MQYDNGTPKSIFGFYKSVDSYGRPVPVELDFTRLPFCECGAAYLSWVSSRFGADLLDSQSPQHLEHALITITKEYDYLRQTVSPDTHPLNTCVYEVYAELQETITTKLEELKRHPPAGGSGPTLYIGQEES